MPKTKKKTTKKSSKSASKKSTKPKTVSAPKGKQAQQQQPTPEEQQLQKLPPEVQIKIEEVVKEMKINHKLAFEKGVPFAIGTDAGTPGNPHGTTAFEIINMIENVGMTSTQALQAATIQASKAIKMDRKIGSIEAEKFADLAICNGNPVEDISILKDTKNLLFVIKDGKIMAEKGKITYFN